MTGRTFTAAGLTLAMLSTLFLAPALAEESLRGFTDERARAQLELEQRFDAQLDAERLRESMKRMTPRPHHVGAAQTRENAEWMLEQFRSWGFEAEIETYWVLFPRPKTRRLTLLEPTRFEARLQEEILEGDSTSKIAVETGLPPFNAYSADGDVTAELVYVNRGVPEDYEELERHGIDVRGKIVIARYGGSWRGIKPKVAYEKGAIGCLIYNDPSDDGYLQGETYPEGAYKHEYGVQRGSVLDLPLRPGDPLTPMRGATEDADRLELSEADNVMKIPVLPLAWKDAQPLLEALTGPVAPRNWRGGLPITYRMGPGPAKVRLELEFDWELTPAYDVIARLTGSEEPDQWIVRGNHHDAWVIGADDPISGMVALLEEARAVGQLAKTGWRPRRTLIYAAWDAEEPALLGSTEWAEHHADQLREKAAVYINSDSNGRGFVNVGGSHALESLVNEVISTVPDPQTGGTIADRRRSAELLQASESEFARLTAGGELRISALGSGSDYSPFLQHLGIASLNVGFGGENGGGEYHTAFDSFDFYQRFGDPTFEYGVALARTAGRLSLRLAEADVLPFAFSSTAATVSRYLDEVLKLADAERQRIERHNRLVEEGHFARAADPTEQLQLPVEEPQAPYLEFAMLKGATDRLGEAARAADRALARALELDDAKSLVAVDRLVFQSERLLTHEEGLPRRPWFRHHLYAPGFYTGYGVKTLPGVREAIEQGDWSLAQDQIEILVGRLNAFSEQLEAIAAAVPRATTARTG